ncbi:helix-turn-helix domain-containing protein [Novosphingobium sp. B 225]|uniref:helix-turn-helix domain-containing protein n=1 Tax=Novosphingobium sp. B 225 TaxID=1961849 RepID=UPI0020CF29C8|nr:helix-turn-helix transcriptional regulator [Novosphingobium sp. B 225]
MSVMERLPSSLAALNDKELEVLRLLAAGHTVKSIAANLGRSEASINERLRDARRKTGVGSSRELARLIDAQKNWDKNIDLSAPSPLTHGLDQPPSAGLFRSKGTLVMLIAIPAAAVGLAIMAAQPAQSPLPPQTANAAPARQSPLVGTWALDVQRIPAAERPQRVTITLRRSQDQKWSSRVEIVAPDGSSTYAESTAAADGIPVPISGTMQFIDTASLRQPAPGTLVMTLGKNGAPVSTRVYTVAKDSKSMTETIVWAGTSMPKLETTYFNRVN